MDEPTELEARFRRTALTRVIHADGAWGGLTPNGGILMALYSERSDMPESIWYDVAPSGEGKQRETQQASRLGLVRDIEVEAVMSVSVARSLVTWLTNKIEEAEELSRAGSADTR